MTTRQRVTVVTDSAASLPEAVVCELGIVVVPLTLVLGGSAGPDRPVDSEKADLREDRPVTTAGPSPGEFVRYIEQAAAGGQVLVATVSSGMSSTYEAARAAADYLSSGVASVVDTGTAAGAEGLVVLAAARAARSGAALEEVAAVARRVADRVRLLATLGDLRPLARSGRVPAAAAWAGGVLGVRPLFEFSDGEVRARRPALSKAGAFERILDECVRGSSRRARLHAAVLEADAPADAAELSSRLERALAGRSDDPAGHELLRAPFSAVMVAHTGPDLVGLAWWWEEPPPPQRRLSPKGARCTVTREVVATKHLVGKYGYQEVPRKGRNMSSLGFPVFDADNHLYETKDALTKYLPPEYQGAIDYVDVHGRTKIVVRGQISDYIPNPTFDRVGRPGAQEEYFRIGNPEGKSYREIIGKGIDCPPAFREASARLELMDELGLDYAMMYPTLASLIEERMKDDPDLCAAAIHALNRWMIEAWPYVYKDRVYSTPIITPGLVNKAIEELEFVVDNGAKVILMRPAPSWGYRGPRSFALPEYDPYWSLVEESGVLVVLHASDSGYVRYTNEWEGQHQEMQAFAQPKMFSASVGNFHRDIQDAVTSLICHGALWRHPKLRIALVENGAGWVPSLLEHLDHTYRTMPQYYEEKPSNTFKRHFWMHPFHEEDPKELVSLLGADHIIFGSDYPHVEGLSNPISYVDELQGLPEDDIRKIMGGNMIDLLGVKVPVGV